MRLVLCLLLLTGAAAAQPQSPLLADLSTLPPQQTALVFGQRIVFREAGSGPTLVLVHGFASEAAFDWGQVMLPLSRNYHVIALDQVGFGASDKPAVDYSIQTFVDFLGEFLRVRRVEHFTLAGESLGGWIAAAYTIQALASENRGPYALPAPDRLILEDAAGHSPLHGPAMVQGSLAEAAGIAIVFYNKALITPDFVRESWTRKLAANDGQTERLFIGNPKVASETVGDKLDRITVPTLVVWGGNDELVPLADGRDYAAKIPGARLVIVPECGHAPSIEKPREFLAAVNDFLH
jgi:pimeloyl-ACP methyl ester carboxylesterase